MKKISEFISSGFGVGFIPFAPGTWGTLVGVMILFYLHSTVVNWSPSYLLALSLVYGLIAYFAIHKLPSHWEHDDNKIVSDELLGMFITMLWIPICIKSLLVGFVAFRLFDIFKPLGIKKIDQIHSNWGVLVDDILAGVYANLLIRSIFLFLPLCP